MQGHLTAISRREASLFRAAHLAPDTQRTGVGLTGRASKRNIRAIFKAMSKPPLIEVEVVPETEGPPPGSGRPAGPLPPVHPLAALILLAVDNLWSLAEWAVVSWVVTIPAAFLSVFVPTLILHRRSLGQSKSKALAWATLLGGIAAVPFSVGGTAIGAALLAWLGIQRLGRPPAAPGHPPGSA